jgi:predicted GNAT family acetyltransferase
MSLHPNLARFDVSLPTMPWRHAVMPDLNGEILMLDEQELDIHYSESDTKGRYGATVAGVASEAELTISKVSPSLIIADHTFVPDELRGRGLAQALAARLIADAREKGQRIVPLCPFVRAYAQKHREELADVIQW